MNKAVKTVSFIAAATMLAKAMGVFREIIIASCYGTSFQTEAYMVARRIPLTLFDITLGAAIVSTFIPVFNRYLQRGEDKQAIDFSNSFINLILLISTAFCIVGILFPHQLINLLAIGADVQTKLLAAKLLMIMFPTIIFTALAYAIVGILQSYGEFNIPAIISLVSNAAVIVYLVFFNKYFGIYGLAVAMLIGWSLQVFVQVPSLIKKKYRYKPLLNFKDKGIKDVFILAIPVLISSWLQPVCFMVNTAFASYMETGSISALEFANTLYIIIVGVFVFAITNYIFPTLSKMSGGGDIQGFAAVTDKSLRSMLIIVLPIMAGMMLLSREIITAVYGRGEFGETSITLTSTALFFYSIGMVGYGTNEILNKCFYAMEDGKTPMVSAVCGIASAVILSFAFTRIFHLKIGGLALSASVSAYVVSAVLVYKMQKRTSLISKELIIFTLKTAVCVAAAVGVASAVKMLVMPYGVWPALLASAFAAVIVYFPLLIVFKINKNLKEGTEKKGD